MTVFAIPPINLPYPHAEFTVTTNAVILAPSKQTNIVRQLAPKVAHPLVFSWLLPYLWSCYCLISEVWRSIAFGPPYQRFLHAVKDAGLVGEVCFIIA